LAKERVRRRSQEILRSLEIGPLSDVASKRVLVADRDEIILVLTRHILTRHGYSVDVTSDVRMLDDLLRLNSYGSILVDVDLTGAEWLRALPPETSGRVIALVSSEHDELPVKATIRKPLELDALAEIVGQSYPNTGRSNDAA
jgi:DNA-binding NtrC family response regulator